MIRTLVAALSVGVVAAEMVVDPEVPGRMLLEVDVSSGVVDLETPAPHITQAYFADDEDRTPLTIAFNEDATDVQLVVPEALRERKGAIALEVAKNSVLLPNGRVVFSALDSRVEGTVAKLESHPGNFRIGFWSKIEDSVVWDFPRTNCGMVSVELTYSLAGKSSDVEVTIGGSDPVTGTIAGTGSWYRYTTVNLGRVYMEKDKPTTVTVKGLKKEGGAVMNLKAVTLRPAPEGPADVVLPKEDGSITLMATDATVYGQKLRWEPQPNKLCLGYWIFEKDYATWDFKAARKGTYKLTMYQGCNEVNAGSEVDVIVGSQTKSFVVKNTGHFQTFVPLELGELELAEGEHRLEVRARQKKNKAVMDIQKMTLVPVE